MKIFLLIIVFSSSLFSQTQKQNFTIIESGDDSSKIIFKAANVVPSKNQFNWQKLKFIAFAHFGINTFSDSEWGTGQENPKIFNPTEFDANQWIRVLKDAGIKLLILTAKHHDGFCLWQSKYTEHSVRNSPWKNGKGDIIYEVAKACKKYGLKFGIYLSPWDRHEKCYGDSPKYNEYFCNQLRELLSNYGEITEVWFDGACGEGSNGKKQIYDWKAYYKIVRELQPKAVIFGMGPDVRWVGTESGYGRETEWNVIPNKMSNLDSVKYYKNPIDETFIQGDLTNFDLGSREKIKNAKNLIWYPAETDVSIRPGWFYHSSQDSLVKTPEQLIEIYFSSVGRNGVLLLNIPPDKRGLLHQNDIKSLTEMKKILDKTFKNNLASKGKIISLNETSLKNISSVLDDNYNTYWMPTGETNCGFEIDFQKSITFNVLSIQENIQIGQRVEEFHLEIWDGHSWHEIVKGTTIGFTRLLKFPSIETTKIRLYIDKSRLEPIISEFGLYEMQKIE